jgi:hypothetical protein
MFTRAPHWSQSQNYESSPYYPLLFILDHVNITLPLTPSGLLPSGFPTKTLSARHAT